MFIPDLDFYPSQIPDPKTATKERGEKKLIFIPFFEATNFKNKKVFLIFEMHKKNIWANFQRMIELFTQNIVTMRSNIWVWDPGSGKTYCGSRVKRAPDLQHCMYIC
jgi:hypothetical protein